ncbi:MAG TPA: hypothetical protein DCR93_10025, partial [Cytophagales bacterium]|nr:hypothetical protein [Cytophagales bacterium]
PPPPEVADILGMDPDDLDYMRDLNALGEGAGFAFGASFKMDTGDLTFLMFYARFKAGAGFDIMLKDYGSATCAGNSGPIGINGWYANGQAYAYFEGKIGIRVKLFGKSKSVNILDIGAAALLQAKLPNPFWMRGIVGGRFSVLGGLVKGNCRFEVTLGEECQIQAGSVVEGIAVISDVTPSDGSADVDVFATPQAVFNLPIGEEFEMVDVDGRQKAFRIKLDQFVIKNGTQTIPGSVSWNGPQDVAAFDAFDILPPQKSLAVTVQVSFEEKVFGKWEPVSVKGQIYRETKTINFTSGNAPDHIPLTNVQYSYPIVNQLNYYVDESNLGYIQLKRGQPYLFEPGSQWIQRGRIRDNNGAEFTFQFQYNAGTRQVSFTAPAGLQSNRDYTLEIMNLPASSGGAIDRNVRATETALASDGVDLEATITNRRAEGTISELQEKEIYSAPFHSSRYRTFVAKVQGQQVNRSGIGLWRPYDIDFIVSFIDSDEGFEQAEIKGNGYTDHQALVSLEADMSTNGYYNQYIYSLLYQNYPLDGNMSITYRDVEVLGLVPTKAVSVLQNNEDLVYDPAVPLPTGNANLRYVYEMVWWFAHDYYDLREQASRRYGGNPPYPAPITKILTTRFPVLQPGSYPIYVRYRLPGRTEISSQAIIRMEPK